MVSAKDLGPVALPLLSRWSRLSKSSPKSLSCFLAENDCLNTKLQLELLENLRLCVPICKDVCEVAVTGPGHAAIHIDACVSECPCF